MFVINEDKKTPRDDKKNEAIHGTPDGDGELLTFHSGIF